MSVTVMFEPLPTSQEVYALYEVARRHHMIDSEIKNYGVGEGLVFRADFQNPSEAVAFQRDVDDDLT